MPEATLGMFGRLKRRFEQLSGIHGKHRSQKEVANTYHIAS